MYKRACKKEWCDLQSINEGYCKLVNIQSRLNQRKGGGKDRRRKWGGRGCSQVSNTNLRPGTKEASMRSQWWKKGLWPVEDEWGSYTPRHPPSQKATLADTKPHKRWSISPMPVVNVSSVPSFNTDTPLPLLPVLQFPLLAPKMRPKNSLPPPARVSVAQQLKSTSDLGVANQRRPLCYMH